MKELKFWCHKILPLVYDDSLSYYEVLCKLRKKLNEVIETVNGAYSDEAREAVQAYVESDEFKEYCRQYYDNYIESRAKGFVHIDDYGAVGDGETDDSGAIADAAEVANELGLPLVADGSKNYLVTMENFQPSSGRWKGIPINTDVDFNGATVTIDFDLNNNGPQHLFNIDDDSKEEYENLGSAVIGRYGTNDSRFYNKVIYVESPLDLGVRQGYSNHMYYEQVLACDPLGNYINGVYYPKIITGNYKITSYDLDLPTITIKNIKFDAKINSKATYLNICRPNVIVDGITLTGYTEVTDGWASCIRVLHTYNVTIQNCMGGNVNCRVPGGGSSGYCYELNGSDITLRNVRSGKQSTNAYPTIGVGFFQNVTFENVEAYRFDSHYVMCGYIDVRNCVFTGVNLSGGWGNFLMENCTIFNQDRNEAVIRRNDCNLPFSGTIAFRNVCFYGSTNTSVIRPFKFSFDHGGQVDEDSINYEFTQYIFDNIKSVDFAGWEWLTFEFWYSQYTAEKTKALIENCVIYSTNENIENRSFKIKSTGNTYENIAPLISEIKLKNCVFISPSWVESTAQCKKLIFESCVVGGLTFGYSTPIPSGSVVLLNNEIGDVRGLESIPDADVSQLVAIGNIFKKNNPLVNFSGFGSIVLDNNIVATDDKTGQEDINGILV